MNRFPFTLVWCRVVSESCLAITREILMLAKMLVVPILLTSLTIPCSAQGLASTGSVECTIELGRDRSTLNAHFSRSDTSAPVMLVTALNLTDPSAPRGFDLPRKGLDEYIQRLSQFAGWFFAGQTTQALWIGVFLEEGEASKDLSLRLPGLVRRLSDYPLEYEIIYSQVLPGVRSLVNGASGLQYVPVTNIRIRVPEWGKVTEATDDWHVAPGGYYHLDLSTARLESTPHLVIQAFPNAFAEWMSQQFGSFFWVFSVSFLVLATVVRAFSKARAFRPVLVALLGGIALGLANIAGWWPLSPRAAMFGGAPLLGVAVPVLVYLVLPERFRRHLEAVITALSTHEPGKAAIGAAKGTQEVASHE